MNSFAGLKVGLVGPLPPPAGGMANQLQALAAHLRAEQVHVEVVATNRPYRPAWLARLRGIRAAFRLLPYLLALRRAARRSDIVHVLANSGWSWHLLAAPAVWIAARYRVPVVVHYHGGEAAGFLARSLRSFRFTLARAQQLVVPSGYLVDVFRGFGITARVVPNLVDMQAFNPVGRATGTRPHLVVVRNLEPVYDNATALRAFALLRDRWPQARLSVAGSGPEAERLQTLAQELGVADAVCFTGRLDRDGIAELFSDADVSINPSLADNMPVSVLEAMAAGVAVVSTQVGGVPYIAEHGRNALLVPPADPVAMAGAVHRLLAEPALREALVARARESVRAFAWPAAGAQWLAVYSDALAGARAR
jgi:glycosyltransferase involved in cell wall biosynthesis